MLGILSGSTGIVFMWIHSLVRQAGNSAADIAAKAALLLSVSNLTVLHSNYNSNTYSGIKTEATTLEFWHSEQAVYGDSNFQSRNTN